MGNFNYDPDRGGNIPADVLRLNGASVRLHGFMVPLDQAVEISQFSLVPSLSDCCFGQPPQLHHVIFAQCSHGKWIDYSTDPITVEGTLRVEEKREDGYIVRVFGMDVKTVKAAAK